MTRAQLLQRLEKEWVAFKDSYAGLSAAELLQPGVVKDWSVKDLIAHVTTWEAETLEYLPTILEGRRPPRYSVTHGGIDAFNAQMTARNAELPLGEVLRRQEEVHRRIVQLIERVPEDQLARETPFRRRLRLDTHSHYPGHARAIRRWREHAKPDRA